MTLVAKRVLVIHQQIQHSIAVKQALEQTGRFEVSPFTSPQAACDHLRKHPQDVVLADLTLPELPGVDLVLRLRAIQPDIAIIASPNHPTVLGLVNDLALQGIVTLPRPARELIPLIEQAVAQMYDNLPDTAQAPPVEESETLLLPPSEAEVVPPPPHIIPEFSNLDQVVNEMGGLQVPGQETVDLSDETPIVQEAVSHPLDVVLQPAEEIPPPAADDTPVSQGNRSLAEQLAADEPPVPTLEDSGTVRDLMLGVNDTNLNKVMSILHGGGAQPVEDDDDDTPVHQDTASYNDAPISTPTSKAGDKTLPTLILESALDDTTPFEGFSLNEFLTDIEANLSPEEQAGYTLPSWIEESEKYTREPDFLPPTLPEMEEEYIAETTQPSSFNRVEAHPEALETEPLPKRRTSRPEAPASLPEVEHPEEAAQDAEYAAEYEEAPEVDDWSLSALVEQERDEIKSLFEVAESTAEPAEEFTGPITERMSPADLEAFVADVRQSQTVQAPDAEAAEATVHNEHETPYIAQLALSLTQVSLELTAEATLLTQSGNIIAYAGPLPRAEIEVLWDETDYDLAPNDEPRIRFITLPSSGTNYMLYSRRTAGDFTLSMLFADKMPLRVIRKQSNRLSEALAAIPEVPLAPPEVIAAPLAPIPVEPPVDKELARPAVGPLTAFAYVWLLKDVQQVLPDSLAHAIQVGLTVYLTSKSWKVTTCQVKEDYVYLLVDAPSEPSPHEVIYDLMQQSATIASKKDPFLEPEMLWADSYLAVIPGRELTVEEIQQFIHFARG